MKMRRLIIATHRDLGYFFAGLTVIYAISGIAVNHVGDWNPNYVLAPEEVDLGHIPGNTTSELGAAILAKLQIEAIPKSVVRMSPDQIKIFLEGRTLTVALPTGHVLDERFAPRTGLYQLNYLHLNHGKGFWTWFADFYGVALLLLAVTGIFIIPGKKGLGGRGRRLMIAGLIVPALFLWIRLYFEG